MTAIVGMMPVVVVRSVVWRPGDNEVAKEVRLRRTVYHHESGGFFISIIANYVPEPRNLL